MLRAWFPGGLGIGRDPMTCECVRVCAAAVARGGFLVDVEVRQLAGCPSHRLEQLLVRWHEGRAVVAAQDVQPIIDATHVGGWCFRDVSVPCASARPLGTFWDALKTSEYVRRTSPRGWSEIEGDAPSACDPGNDPSADLSGKAVR